MLGKTEEDGRGRDGWHHQLRGHVLCHAWCLQSCPTLCTLCTARLLCPWDSPGKNTRVGCYALFQGIFPTQGPNPGLPDCRQILYHLSHQGNLIKPKIIFISNELLVYLALYLLVYFVGVTIYEFLSQASCLFAEHSG